MDIYKVTTEGDCEGRTTSTLGYCTGNTWDIEAYFDDKKTYNIHLEKIEVKHITKESAEEKQRLLDRKAIIEEELKKINSRL
jgi:hypothetical protein